MAPKSVTIDRGIKSVTRGVPGPPGDISVPISSLTFDTVNPDLPLNIAQLTWDGEDDTLQFRQNGTTLQIGQEIQWPVVNKSGADIVNGTPVMAVGTTGATGRMNIAPMDGTDTANVKLFGGLTSEDIDDTDNGKVTAFGKVRDIQTNGANYGETWVDSDIIYVSPTIVGALTNIEPTVGQVKIPFAFVINSHVSSGVLAVRVTPINEGLLLSQDQKAAVDGANTPSALNPFATMNDVLVVDLYSDLISIITSDDFTSVKVFGRNSIDDGGGGSFRWDSSDLSTQVSSDVLNGIYVPPTTDVTGSSGAWVRQIEGTIDPRWFGASIGGDSAAAIEAALNSVMGPVELFAAGEYLLEVTGDNPYIVGNKKCIYILNDNAQLILHEGVTLKLADNQQVDANGPVDLIIWGPSRSNISIKGGGRITGNTAGQAGWTGGYAQNSNGNIISSYGGGDSNIIIDVALLDDHFSNPINLGLAGGIPLSDILIHNLHTKNMGEGAQVIGASNVKILGYTYTLDSGIVMAGDQLELSACSNFIIDDVIIDILAGTPEGSAIDIFGSIHGVVSNIVIDGAVNFMGLGTTVGGQIVDDVKINNAVLKNLTGSNCLAIADGDVQYNNILAKDCAGTLLQVPDDAGLLPPVKLNNVVGDNCSQVLISGSRGVVWKGGGNINSKDFGISFEQNSSGETRNIDFDNLDFSEAVNDEFRLNAAGFGPQYLIGRLTRMTLSAAVKFVATDLDDLSGLVVSNITPEKSGQANQLDIRYIGLFKHLVKGSNALQTFLHGSRNQTVRIVAVGTFSVKDASDISGVDIYLNAGVNKQLQSGDILDLMHLDSILDGVANTGWYEVLN